MGVRMSVLRMLRLVTYAFTILLGARVALAQSNPVPFIHLPLGPGTAAPGAADLTLAVHGGGFVAGSTVKWSGAGLATTFVSSAKLTATVPAEKLAAAGTAMVTVVNPGPGGGRSNAEPFAITAPHGLTFTRLVPNPDSSAQSLVVDLDGDGVLDLVSRIPAAEP